MKTINSCSTLIFLLFIIFCTLQLVNGKCKMMTTGDEEHAVYSCIHSTLDDVNDIPDEAEWIRFTVSRLSHLPERVFSRFALHGLSFYNCEVGHIDPNAFDGLDKLQQLTFYGSNIRVVKASWFKNMSSLTHLFLEQNDMVYIEPKVFSLTHSLEYLNIEDNNLNCLPSQALVPLRKLKHVRFAKNPWLCNCYAELVGSMKNRKIDYGVQNITATSFECMAEYGMSQTDELKMELDKIYETYSPWRTEYVSITPRGNVLCVGNNISILSEIPENAQSIKFLNSLIPVIPRVAFFRFGNSLKILDLSNSSVSEIHPEAFAGLSKLERLILFNNSISMVRAEWFRDLRSLKHLVLDNNGIEHVQTSVFPLLDKIETLSLRKNDIGCFPMRGFASMKHLKEMTIANNTWICSCFRDFRKWLNMSEIAYPILPTQCNDKKMHKNGSQYILGYRNATFEIDFENEERKIINDNIRLAAGGTLQGIEPYGGASIETAPYENQRSNVTREEAYHKRNKEIANYEYYRLRAEQSQQRYMHVMRAKYEGFERTAVPKVPPGYVLLYIHHNQRVQTTESNGFKTSSVEPSSSYTTKSYVSVGGTMWDIAAISRDAETIRFERSAIHVIVGEILVRYVELRVLEFVNCGVQEIEPLAFKGLANLQELVLDDNEIAMVKSAWFKDIPNLERLSLLRNSITRIENGVFQLWPNLKHLGISDNNLNCIGIDGLSHLKKLHSITVGNNPWSCLCQMKLNEWLIEHKIQYDKDIFYGRAEWSCIGGYTGPKIAKYQNKNSTDNGRFQGDLEVEEPVKIQEAKYHAIENSKVTQTQDNNTDLNRKVAEVLKTEYPRGQCRFHLFNASKEGRWWCNGGDILGLDQIPCSAERIDFTDSNIATIPANAFVRFSNLTKLLFYNCSIRDIDPLAFAGLKKLEWLIFVNNSIPVIRSAWFHETVNVTLLGLVKNGITEIEPDVFQYLPNLEGLFIKGNNLRCIYTKSLLSLKHLQKVWMHNNPWKWRCRAELTQLFDTHNISYVNSESYDTKDVVADLIADDNF